MASKRIVLGSICKREKDGSKYLKVNLNPNSGLSAVTLRNGDFVNIETNDEQLSGAQQACADGKISEEVLAKIQKRLADQPDFVIAQAVLTRKED